MNRRHLLIAATLFMVLNLVSQSCLASHRTRLEEAACEYRDAATHFAEEVVSNPDLSHSEKRLAPMLVRAAGRIHVMAQHPHLHRHLRTALQEVEFVHRRIEAVLFAHPGCPVSRSLLPCWEEVLCAYRDLATELHRLDCHYGYPNHHVPQVHRPNSSPWAAPNWSGLERGVVNVNPALPSLGQPNAGHRGGETTSYRYREAVVPSYRYGNFGHKVLPPWPPTADDTSPSRQQIDEVEQQRDAARRSRAGFPSGASAAGASLQRFAR